MRLIILTGMIVTAVSLWQMTGFSLQMGMWPLITTGLLQGFGLGFVFTPLSVVTFSTLPRNVLTQGTAIFSLMRNIGGSVGISIVEALFVENTQIVHSRLVEHVRPDNPAAQRCCRLPYSLTKPARHRRAQSRDHPPGADDRLYRQFLSDAGGDPGRLAVPAAAAPPAPRRRKTGSGGDGNPGRSSRRLPLGPRLRGGDDIEISSPSGTRPRR